MIKHKKLRRRREHRSVADEQGRGHHKKYIVGIGGLFVVGLLLPLLCTPTLVNLAITTLLHLDLTWFITVEKFLLANVTGFIDVFEFIEKLWRKVRGKRLVKGQKHNR